MPGILWLASYPKSGNTWLRGFLANYFTNAQTPIPINELPKFIFGDGLAAPFEKVAGKSVRDFDVQEIHRLRPKVHEMFAGSSPDIVFVKTHNAISVLDDIPTITPEVTAGAVYIIRNPLDVVVSYAHHFDRLMDRAIEALGSEETVITPHSNQVYQYLGAWSSHVRSWTTAPGLRLHVLRYEDMASKPFPTFRRLVDFLGLPLEMPRLKKAIRFSTFKVMADQEARAGFVEARPDKKQPFFRQGTAGKWRRELTGEQVDKLITDHREVMAEHGYLKKDGKPAD